MNRLSRNEAVGRAVPPHPGPLPRGEGEPFGSAIKGHRLLSFPAGSKRAPSPWGEGRGEGERDVRTAWIRLKGGRAAPKGTYRQLKAPKGTINKDVLLIKTWWPRDCAGLSGALDCACPSGAFSSMTPMRENHSSCQPLSSPNPKRQRNSRTPKPGGLRDCAGLSGALDCACPSGALACRRLTVNLC